jgi:tRNA (adenine57-N1/adenine58-N1)-methyltransferase
VLDPDILDIYEKMPRSGSYMLKKDIGLFLVNLGLGSGETVVDAGSGSGSLAIFMGKVVGPNGKIVTYEKNPEFAEIAKRNFIMAGLGDVIEGLVKDVLEGFEEEDDSVDAVTLDMFEAWKVVNKAKRILKRGRKIGAFSPYLEQAKEVHLEILKNGFKEVKTIESTMREIEFRKQGTRPKTSRVGHSGYLTFGRKV